MPKRYQEELARVREINRREELRRTMKCILCGRQGHMVDDCRGVRLSNGMYLSQTNDTCGETPPNDEPLYMLKVPPKMSLDTNTKVKYFCNICNKEGHTSDRCRKQCVNSRCTIQEPHHYQNCPNYFCKKCFTYHKIPEACNPTHYIIEQYLKYGVCECNAVQFYRVTMNNIIATYNMPDIPFFVTYPKPIANRYCQSHIFCEFVKPNGDICRRHHATEEHSYFE